MKTFCSLFAFRSLIFLCFSNCDAKVLRTYKFKIVLHTKHQLQQILFCNQNQYKQAREIEQESGTKMRGIMSGRGFVDYS